MRPPLPNTRSTMDKEESSILKALDLAVRSEAIRPKIDAIVTRVEQKLRESPDDMLAWEPIPLDFYTAPLLETIRSSWVFILRANTTTGAERHPQQPPAHDVVPGLRRFSDPAGTRVVFAPAHE